MKILLRCKKIMTIGYQYVISLDANGHMFIFLPQILSSFEGILKHPSLMFTLNPDDTIILEKKHQESLKYSS